MDTYEFLNTLDISYLHVFSYSERANTPALGKQGVVPMKERSRRSRMLRGLSEKKKRFFYEQSVGQTASVLFEEDIENGMMHGFTENYIRVAAKYDPLLINELKPVVLHKVNEQGLMEVTETDAVLV